MIGQKVSMVDATGPARWKNKRLLSSCRAPKRENEMWCFLAHFVVLYCTIPAVRTCAVDSPPKPVGWFWWDMGAYETWRNVRAQSALLLHSLLASSTLRFIVVMWGKSYRRQGETIIIRTLSNQVPKDPYISVLAGKTLGYCSPGLLRVCQRSVRGSGRLDTILYIYIYIYILLL